MNHNWEPSEVTFTSRPIESLGAVVSAGQMAELEAAIPTARAALKDRVIWNVSSTATGGGVAEMLRGILPYVASTGVAVRWLILGADQAFFRITKRIHHAVHGSPGDGSPLDDDERRLHYEDVLAANARHMLALIRPGDPVILHDPQTAGLIPALRSHGALVVWRSHIGTDTPNNETDAGWGFLLPYVRQAHALVFSRQQYVPPALSSEPVTIIPPSIDPLTAKNREMPPEEARAILVHTGIIQGPDGVPMYVRDDGSQGRVDRSADIMRLGEAPGWDRPIVTQISRWDPLKDHAGVLNAFVELLQHSATDAYLVLAGPNVHGVPDDPEQQHVFDQLIAAWREVSHSHRARIDLVSLPTADNAENAAIVNALQSHSTIVVQKSLQEGFGLTVTEAMWKRRPVVASAVGGITDQIEDGVSGILLQDPRSARELAAALERVLGDPDLAARLGSAARERVCEQYLASRQMLQYARLLIDLVAAPQQR